jgi:hypothetical protein
MTTQMRIMIMNIAMITEERGIGVDEMRVLLYSYSLAIVAKILIT